MLLFSCHPRLDRGSSQDSFALDSRLRVNDKEIFDMDFVHFTIEYMYFNTKLALLAVIFGWIMYEIDNRWVRTIFFILWLLFVPNTIYLFTDIVNFYRDSQGLDPLGVTIILLLHGLLLTIGLFTFVTAMFPFEQVLKMYIKGDKRKYIQGIIVTLNFIIGFGMVLGRVLRVNSWDVFVHPNFVLWAVRQVLTSGDLAGLAILFGLFASLLYYTFKAKVFAAYYVLFNKRKVY